MVKDLQIRAGDQIETPRTPPPSVWCRAWHEPPTTMPVARDPICDDYSDGFSDPDEEYGLDLAVIELEQTDDKTGLNTVDGIIWRDPVATDKTYVFGYPPLPKMLDAYMLVNGGEVVNPRVLTCQTGEVVNPAVESLKYQRFFLYSSTTRRGNSGGPIVAQDGRVIGVVAHSTFAPESTIDTATDDDHQTEFQRGIPGGEVIDWLNKHEIGHLAKLEDWER